MWKNNSETSTSSECDDIVFGGFFFIENNDIRDKEKFLKGCIAPDLLDKKTSHYGNSSDNTDFQKFLEQNSLSSEYNQGYLLHLISDYLFYNKYLKNFIDEFSDEIYHDYNKLNEVLIKKYNVEVPSEIESVVGLETGEPINFDRESICRFIDAVAQIDLEKCKNLEEYLKEYKIEKEEETEFRE